MTACPSCGAEAPQGARFCAFCGAAIAAPTPREERKTVSVVFLDLVGHTARSESADPDAVMAVFGAPVAHEDDAERAVRGALALRDAFVEEGPEVRIAVNTGEALVSLEAQPETGEAMVAGDVVNTAARLQSAAPVNGVLVGEATRRATERAIEYRTSEPVAAKGKAAPVHCWEALPRRARRRPAFWRGGVEALGGQAGETGGDHALHGRRHLPGDALRRRPSARTPPRRAGCRPPVRGASAGTRRPRPVR